MTQQMADQFGATIYSPPPSYMDLYSVVPSDDFIHKQTNIKATSRNVSIAREANICCQAHTVPSPQPAQSASPLTSLTDGHGVTVSSDTSSLTLPHVNSRHSSPLPGGSGASSNSSSLPLLLPNSHQTSPFSASPVSSDTTSLPLSHQSLPFLGDPPSQHPAHLNDLFYAHSSTQPPWPGHDTTHNFNFMIDDSFPSMLLSDPVMGMTAASGQNETQWANPLPPLNLIPPTPLKDIDNTALHGTLGSNTFTRVSSQQLDLSYYPSNAHT
ncbi:uncharacterized protein BJ212DRAFT_1486659 [Suillus subaureus]|uniref:Uncharacterized protein n=1 Tax=Suillus subaureus TaxID=48587 RepID=A0A9P7J5S2_9AGAM|nr:uncharacterized protein BJ212DRAFT_1486659 [Suillus subaureus]KAG1804539.1 hypothetical protein BJ212DRAFT_1486659 [Suillus subaureus]